MTNQATMKLRYRSHLTGLRLAFNIRAHGVYCKSTCGKIFEIDGHRVFIVGSDKDFSYREWKSGPDWYFPVRVLLGHLDQ